MTRKPWFLLIEFVVLTIVFTLIWVRWGREAYLPFFLELADPIFAALELPPVKLRQTPQRFMNYAPFLALMLITPGMSLLRRCLGIVLGVVVLFYGHVLMVWIAYDAWVATSSLATAFPMTFPTLLLSDALPFALWVVFAEKFIRDLSSQAARKVGLGPSN